MIVEKGGLNLGSILPLDSLHLSALVQRRTGNGGIQKK
jgi:hypothetical protein